MRARALCLVWTAALLVGVAVPTPAQTTVANQSAGDTPSSLPANNDVNDGTDNTDVGLLQVEVGSVFARTDSATHTSGTPITAHSAMSG